LSTFGVPLPDPAPVTAEGQSAASKLVETGLTGMFALASAFLAAPCQS
jgi:hypothetical protein